MISDDIAVFRKYKRDLNALSRIPFLLTTFIENSVAIIWLWAVIQANLRASFTDYKTGLISCINTIKVKPNNCLGATPKEFTKHASNVIDRNS